MHQELCSHFCFVLNTFIISDVYGAEQMALCIIYDFQVYFHMMFQCFAQFANLFLNVFLLYFRFFILRVLLCSEQIIQMDDDSCVLKYIEIVPLDYSAQQFEELKPFQVKVCIVTIASENCNCNLTLDITVIYASCCILLFFLWKLESIYESAVS